MLVVLICLNAFMLNLKLLYRDIEVEALYMTTATGHAMNNPVLAWVENDNSVYSSYLFAISHRS